MIKYFLIACCVFLNKPVTAAIRLVVAADGSGDHRTIQGAIHALPANDEPAVIRIKPGIYYEKIYIERAHITLEGTSQAQTIIRASIARDEWRCVHQDDWGVATMNIGANDITLRNLTIANTYGTDVKEVRTIVCINDTADGKAEIGIAGHQMAIRVMGATRLRAFGCHFISRGGDTVSPWEVYAGQWYFKDCIMEGAVDLYCPRGWAWAENCTFIAHSGTAILWHDGSKHEQAKTVLKNCRFQGYDGFRLGRYHRDAQFFLIDCQFASNMRDEPIVKAASGNSLQWGHRVYYFNCHKADGKDYDWFANHLPEGLSKNDIQLSWVFENKWNPEKE